MGKRSNHLLFQLDVKKSEIRDGITGVKKTGNNFTDITFTVAILTKIIIGAGKNRRSN